MLMTTSDEQSYISMLADAFEIDQNILMDDWHMISSAAREVGFIPDLSIMDQATVMLSKMNVTTSRINDEGAQIMVRILKRRGILH